MKFKIWVLLAIIIFSSTVLFAQEKPDERLKNKITYYSGYVRLSDAVADISTQSGIKIYTGTSTRDWQIRDLPVVICANDIEIGKLLKMITDAYYLTLNKELVDGKYIYRIYRPQVNIKKIQDYFNAIDAYNQHWTSLNWDVLTLLGSKNDSQAEDLYNQMIKDKEFINNYKDNPRLAFNLAISYSKIINAISARKNDGKPIVVWANEDSKLGNLVKDYMYYYLANADGLLRQIPDNVDENSFYIDFKVDESGVLSPNSTVHIKYGNEEVSTLGENVYVKPFADGLNIPVKPYPEQVNSEIDGFNIAEKSEIKKDKTKYKLEKPDKKDILLSDVISSISKTTGYSIVADDYDDHKDLRQRGNYSSFLGSESNLYDMLNYLRFNSNSNLTFYVKDNQIILKHLDWTHQYFDWLIPKAYLLELIDKFNGNGLDLMDYAKLNSLSIDQKQEWIYKTTSGEGLWGSKNKLFDTLTPFILNANNNLLTTGILLKEVDKKTISKLLSETNTDFDSINFDTSYIKLMYKAPNNPSNKYTYDMVLYNGQEEKQVNLGVYFPIYSVSKNKELFLQRQAQGAKQIAPALSTPEKPAM